MTTPGATRWAAEHDELDESGATGADNDQDEREDDLDANTKGFWSSVQQFFLVTWAEDPHILYIAASILLVSALLGGRWFYQPLRKLKQDLRKIAADLKKVATLESSQVHQWAAAEPGSFPGLREAWRETVARIVWLPAAQGARPVFAGSPRDLWTPPRLLAGRLNLGLAEAMPNLLVGVGLLFTFLFLTLALAGATKALADQGGGQHQLLDATRELLHTAGGKFVTSLAGLFASVAWTVFARWQMARLDGCCDAVLTELDRIAPFTGSERALVAQFDLFGGMLKTLEAQQATGQAVVNLLTSQKQLTEDLLGTTQELHLLSEEQKKILGNLTSDLVVALGSAIDTALAPRFDGMTQQLVSALERLTERIGTINQESLDRMAHEHARRLAEATKEEMAEFKGALVGLASQLAHAGSSLHSGAGEAARQIEDAGGELVARMGESGANFRADLAAAAKAMMDAAAASSGQLDNAGQRIAEGAEAAGAQLVTAMQGAADTLRERIDGAAMRLQTAGEQAATSIDSASASMSRHGEALATTMEAKVVQCAQTLERAGAQVDQAMTGVMLRLGEAAQQASAHWASGVAGAVDLLTLGAQTAAGVLGNSTAQAATSFDASAARLAEHAANFGEVMSAKLDAVAHSTAAMSREVLAIAEAAHRLAAQGEESAAHFQEGLVRAGVVVQAMGQTASSWEPLIASLHGAANDVRSSTVSIGELGRAMSAVNTDLAARAPQALAAIAQVTELLARTARETRDATESSRRAMDDTSKTLHKTVAEMREGVGAYSGQVAALHQQLDAALSKAISGINSSIHNMSGAIEALNDSFGQLPQRG